MQKIISNNVKYGTKTPLNPWGIQTQMDKDYLSATFEDLYGNTLTPTEIQRIGSLYIISFDTEKSGIAILYYV